MFNGSMFNVAVVNSDMFSERNLVSSTPQRQIKVFAKTQIVEDVFAKSETNDKIWSKVE